MDLKHKNLAPYLKEIMSSIVSLKDAAKRRSIKVVHNVRKRYCNYHNTILIFIFKGFFIIRDTIYINNKNNYKHDSRMSMPTSCFALYVRGGHKVRIMTSIQVSQ